MSSTVEIQPHSESDCSVSGRRAPWASPITTQHVNELFAASGPVSPARRAELIADPGFPRAMRTTASELIKLHMGNPVLNRIISDRGRFFVSLFVLDLHFRRHDEGIGLTPGRLKQVCLEQDVCGPTRCNALLALMKLGGYLEAAPDGSDRRRRELVPTAKLIAAQRDRWRCQFAGAAAVIPDAARALDMLERPELMHGLVRLMSAHIRAGFRFSDYLPALRLFGERHGGLFALCTIVANDDANRLAHHAPIEISVSDLARSTSSSRAHIVKLLKDAESEGLLERPSLGAVVLQPRLVHDLSQFFALNYLVLTHFASITIERFALLSAAPLPADEP